jgi:ABC-type nitrate/sulfonate/bicarbonate transport system ATPase subunit
MTDYFPFRELGFRCNPFRRPTAEEWAELAVLPGGLLAAVHGGEHVQVVGAAGRGKSTLYRA